MITALAGGVGGAKLLSGLSRVMQPEKLTIIGNTGDDIELFGLRVCPDLDTVAYTLGGRANKETGWGVDQDTFECLGALRAYGCEAWFQLGDRDLATHLFRTHLLAQGLELSEVTRQICHALGVRCRLLPMTEAYVPTRILTDEGDLHLQEYLVRWHSRPRVRALRYSNIEFAQPAPQVKESIRGAQAVVICPSNPLISIGPILAVPDLRQSLESTDAPVVAVTPLVAGKALKGPAAKMLQELGHPVSAQGVARLYQDVVDVFVLDEQDTHLKEDIETLGMKVVTTNTVMTTLDEKLALARKILEIIGVSP